LSRASREFVSALEGLMESFHQEQKELFHRRGITPVQFFVLRWTSMSSGANMSNLARFLGIRPQSATPLVDALETMGYVRRTRSTEDRRELRLELTPRGRQLIETIRGAFRARLASAMDATPSDSLLRAAAALRVAAATVERDRLRARAAGRGRPKAAA
jgi:DNA-binding MarR family transcriptional regulator